MPRNQNGASPSLWAFVTILVAVIGATATIVAALLNNGVIGNIFSKDPPETPPNGPEIPDNGRVSLPEKPGELEIIKRAYVRASQDPNGAIEMLDEVLQKNPESAEAYLVRAMIYAQDKLVMYYSYSSNYSFEAKCRKAIEDYDRIIHLKPNLNDKVRINGINKWSGSLQRGIGDIHLAKALAYVGLGDSQKAMLSFEKAANIYRSQQNDTKERLTYRAIGYLREGLVQQVQRMIIGDFIAPQCTDN